MHTNSIRRVATDAAGRIALTCSNDKTARLWALPNLKSPVSDFKSGLLRTFCIPIGTGDEGKLYSCALSPDGALAALTGWTGYEWDKAISIYLFDTASGQLLRRLSGLPNVINDLAFSPSGQTLAAVLFGGNGLRLFATRSGQLLAQDSDYGADSYGVDWQGERSLVTTCWDGKLRLYQDLDLGSAGSGSSARSLTPSHSRSLPQGKQPFAARWSPDGRQIAIGFQDSIQVAFVSATDLSSLPSPSTSGIANGDLASVAWSADGRSLAAGGMWVDASGARPIRLWRQSSGKALGSPQDLPLAQNALMDLRPLPGGGFLWGAADPAWGITTAGGSGTVRSERLGSPPIADHRGLLGKFRLSADASVLGFGFQQWGKQPASFHLAERRLTLDPAATTSLHTPRTEGLPITDWQNTTAPKLNSKPLKLEAYERSRSLAIAPDHGFFLLGTGWNLRCYAKDGTERWAIPVPDVVWAVNLSADGSLAVAAYGDGSIRWHRASDGRELLAFFPHADQKRWVLWTPEGYYDCSADGESLICWHVNRGKDQAADFFPAAQFREQFYRPDVISQVLNELSVEKALAAANAETGRRPAAAQRIEDVMAKMQPPVIELLVGGAAATLTPQNGSVTLRYRVRQGGSALTRMKLLLDGRPIDTQAPTPTSDSTEATATVPVPAQDCLLTLLAENATSVSTPATLRIVAPASRSPAIAATPEALKPKLYLLAVGISDYAMNDAEADPKKPLNAKLLPDLVYSAKDAQDFTTSILRQEGLLYQKVESRLLTDQQANAGDILDALDWLKQSSTARDVVMIFLSGHGENDNELRYFFCPHDYDSARRLRTGVSFEDIQKTIASLPGKVVFFIDSCHAGNALGKLTKKGATVDVNRVINELSSAENGTVVFASSTGRQQSIESEEWNNGAFTKALVEGLDGKADLLQNGEIKISTLEAYVANRVKELTEGEQTPTVAKPQTVQDYTIAVKK